MSGLVVQGVEISRPLQGISGKWAAGPVPLHEQQRLVRAMAAIIALTGKAILPKLSPTTRPVVNFKSGALLIQRISKIA